MSVAKKVLGTYVLITPVKEQVTSVSGLELSIEDSNQLRYKQGVVVQAGLEAGMLEEGDKIYYDSRAGHSMMLNGITYSLITVRDVSVVL